MKNTLMAGLAVLAVSAGGAMAAEPDWTVGIDPHGDVMYEGYSGNLQFLAPGQPVPLTLPSWAIPNAEKWDDDDFWVEQEIGYAYKFTLLGVEAHADSDGVVGWYSWGGYMQTFSEQYAIDEGQAALDCTESGWWYFDAYVNGEYAGDIEFGSALVGYRGSVQQNLLNTPIVINDQDITFGFYLATNSRGIDGYMKIIGSILRSKPEPSGQLTFAQSAYPAGEAPEVGWNIERGE